MMMVNILGVQIAGMAFTTIMELKPAPNVGHLNEMVAADKE